ncbi:Geraniol 8-hydroxylase [Capsicum baccatum]|uniref:Geraniol 8-hydroxylase n=1 Tax=Capsicum baccatum TaxID=33114 RepID=A0A2G2V782_CAPBA|nr:Geraniol 8-hydroxylase [Capsicum baccatum]
MFQDLFIGGTDTTISTLEWAMAETLRQPYILKKAQAEIAEVVGKGKSIEEVDVSRLPYLQFIVKETLRMHPPAPFLVPRRVDQDIELCDYIIPKGSMSLELNVRGNDFELILLGAGRRICPGLPLALTVILGSMLNSFNWQLEACIEPKDMDMEEKFGVILAKALPLRAIPSPL